MSQTSIESLEAERLMAHLRVLCDQIGPRAATSREERRAAEYVRATLEGLGIDDIRDQFFSSHETLGWITMPPLVLAAIAPLMRGAFAKLFGGAALLLAAKGFYDGLLTKMPFYQPLVSQGTSQNVIARIAPSGAVHQRVFLVAHLDSNKQRFSFPMEIRELTKPLATFTLVMTLLGGLKMVADALTGKSGIGKTQALASLTGLGVLGMLALDEMQPYVEGANDNGSAVAVLLGLAETLKAQPLAHTEVTLLFTGCEEVGGIGMGAYLHQYAPPAFNTTFIDLEMVGTGRLCYVTRHGMSYATEYVPGPHITALAAEVAAEQTELRVTGKDMLMVDEMALLRSRGYEAICIAGYDDQGYLPNWHRVADSLDRIEPDTLQRAARFTHALIVALDAKAGA